MNILYCEQLRAGNMGTNSVHIYEVVANLSKLGHKVVLLNSALPKVESGLYIGQRSLWNRTRNTISRSAIVRPFIGELSILWTILHEIYVFIRIFTILIRHRGNFDIIYRRHHLLNSEYFWARLLGIPSVKEVNGILIDETRISKSGDKASLWFMDRIEKFNIHRADKMVVVTSRLKELLQSDYGIKSEKITVIENGANTDLFKPMDVTATRDKLNLDQNHSYICYTGHLVEWQGLKYLIRSMPQILKQSPKTRLLIVGDGPIRQELVTTAEQVGVSNKVTFTGFVSYPEVPLYINASDVCVIPSEKNVRHDKCGGSPLKVKEYMACAKPVVASRLSGVEVIERNTLGILVEPNNPAELAKAIVKLIKTPRLRKQMGESGRSYVIKNYSWQRVAEKVADFCQSLVNNRTNVVKQ